MPSQHLAEGAGPAGGRPYLYRLTWPARRWPARSAEAALRIGADHAFNSLPLRPA